MSQSTFAMSLLPCLYYFGAGKRPPVKVTINNSTYRSGIAVMNGIFMLDASAGVWKKIRCNRR